MTLMGPGAFSLTHPVCLGQTAGTAQQARWSWTVMRGVRLLWRAVSGQSALRFASLEGGEGKGRLVAGRAGW